MDGWISTVIRAVGGQFGAVSNRNGTPCNTQFPTLHIASTAAQRRALSSNAYLTT